MSYIADLNRARQLAGMTPLSEAATAKLKPLNEGENDDDAAWEKIRAGFINVTKQLLAQSPDAFEATKLRFESTMDGLIEASKKLDDRYHNAALGHLKTIRAAKSVEDIKKMNI